MKKIKLMLVAFMAMIGVNAFAANLVNSYIQDDTKGFRYTVLTADNTAKTGTVSIVGNNYATLGAAVLEIPETFTWNVTADDASGNFTFTVTEIGASGFAGITKITSVSIPKSVTKINASAFEGCSQLASVTFAAESELFLLGNYVFGTTPSLTSISFENCAKLIYFTSDGLVKTASSANTYTTPFVPSSGYNNELATITLGSETVQVGTALAGCKALATVNLEDTKITGLVAGSLADCNALKSIELPATAYDFAATSVPGLTSIKFNGKGETGKALAFAGPSFTMDANNDATITFDDIEVVGTIAKDAFVGPTKDGKGATVVVDEIKAALANELVSNNVTSFTTGKISAAVNSDVFGAAVTINLGEIAATGSIAAFAGTGNAKTTTLNFTGDITGASSIATDAFTKFSKLANVTITGVVKTAAAFQAGSFGGATAVAGSGNTADDDGYKLFISYEPAAYIAAFAQDAFLNATTGSPVVKLTTNRIFGVGFEADNATYGSPADLFNVFLAFAAETIKIPVGKNSGTMYYGTLYNATTKFKIAKAQNGGKVMVYGAYVDQEDKVVYMDQLHVIGGFYYVPNDCPVIVKTDKPDEDGKVEATAYATTENSMNYTSGTDFQSELCVATTAISGTTLMHKTNDIDWTKVARPTNVNNENFDLFVMAPPANYGLFFTKFTAATEIPAGTFYLRKTPSAASRLDVVWLDGSEDSATAIKAVKKVSENGAIYNLAGQKVSAAYKGVVIKDGKKFIQK